MMTEIKSLQRPNLFIVGAGKSGTTSLHDYLGQHPEIFMSPEKEPMYFFNLDLRYLGVLNKGDYLKLFQKANGEKVIGESSSMYLSSESAAKDIKAFAPDAKIIIMLRDPLEMMHSLHSQNIYNGDEDLLDFRTALETDPLSRKGVKRSHYTQVLEPIDYLARGKYTAQVKRYFEAFGRQNVEVIIYDDFKKDTQGTYQLTLKFLGVDPTFKAEFTIQNPNKRVKHLFLRKVSRSLLKPFPGLKGIFPMSLQNKAREFLFTIEQRKPIDAQYEKELRGVFIDEIIQLENLLGKDLHSWKG